MGGRNKGTLTTRQKFRDWPFLVYTPQPAPAQTWRKLDVMIAFCRGRDHETASAYMPGMSDGVWWCFRHEEDATAFIEAFPEGERREAPLKVRR